MLMDGSAILTNNTITQNICLDTTSEAKGAGLHVLSSGSFTGMNNIVYDNYAIVDPEFFGTVNFTYSCSSVPLSGTGNITSNPQFINPSGDDFHLQATSPCIDTGSPNSPLDPDSSRADMGALYYNHQVAPQQFDITLTPLNPPIVLPARGGRFRFAGSVVHTGTSQTPFTIWARIKSPGGSYTSPTLGPVTINSPLNITVTRLRTQTVPGSWAPGLYTYLGYASTSYSYPALDSSSFTFTKSATADGGPFVWDASCAGDPFPYEVGGTRSLVSEFALVGAYPNPFNPTTNISFTLPETGPVTLTVWDVNGRAVATLLNGTREAGAHQVTFDGSGLVSGLYIYTLTASNHSSTGKLMLIK